MKINWENFGQPTEWNAS